jgi:hypothetical protein
MWPSIEPDKDNYIDTYEAMKNLYPAEKNSTFSVLIIVHECLKILKMLAYVRPNDAISFSLENLLVHDGQLIMSDSCISK